MVFNDTSGKSGIIQQCEFWTGMGDTAISGDSTLLLKIFTGLINIAYHQVITKILKAQDEWDFDDPNIGDTGFMKTYNLTANTQYIDIGLTSKILKVKRVEVELDNANWKKAEPLDIGELDFGTSDTTLIASHFSTDYPKYDQHGRYVFFYPIPLISVTAGAKLWVTREVDEFVVGDTTQEPGFDKPFHQLIPLMAALDWGLSHRLDNRAEVASKIATLTADLEVYYGKKNEDRQLSAKAYVEDYN